MEDEKIAFDARVAKNIKKAMDKQRVGFSLISKECLIPRSTLYSWTAGVTPNLRQLTIVANFLDVSLDELVSQNSPPPNG
jgi:predicted transcriptional regulator